MNNQPNQIPKETFERTDELIRLGAEAVRDAQEKARVREISNVYSLNGRIYHDGPNGLKPDAETDTIKD